MATQYHLKVNYYRGTWGIQGQTSSCISLGVFYTKLTVRAKTPILDGSVMTHDREVSTVVIRFYETLHQYVIGTNVELQLFTGGCQLYVWQWGRK